MTELRFASSARPWITLGGGGKAKDDLCNRGERVHGGSISLVRWSDAPFGYKSTGGKFRLGYAIGLISSTVSGPRHILQRMSKLTRVLVTSSLGGEVSALTGMVVHMLLLKEFYGPPAALDPDMAGVEACEILFTPMKNKKMIAKNYPARRFSASSRP